MHIEENGNITPCCVMPSNIHFVANGIKNYQNSSTLKEIKKYFKQDKQHPHCQFCWDAERNGVRTQRNSAFVDLTKLKKIHLRFNNICNFKCRMCNPKFSSSWAEENKKHKYFVHDYKLEKDIFFILQREFIKTYRQDIMMPKMAFDNDYNKGMRLFVDGLQKMGMNKASDANSTMRFTYGNVLPYDPADAVHYDFYTTLEGVMQKEVKTDDKNHEFYVPQRLKDLYNAKDFGPYARKEDGKLPVGFLSNNDITGGNSGSPVINAYGELIGTAFDGNWEAMSGDIYFEPNIQRTISVDVRYTLFIIDKYAGASHLIDEMNIITERHVDEPVKEIENKPEPVLAP